MKNGKILIALAHPDDESFGMGGTIAYYISMGVEVHLICATRGEAGDVEPELLEGYSSIAELREAELRCAAKKLGLTGLYFLDYRDSGMLGMEANSHPDAFINAPIDDVAAKIVSYIRKIQPQIIITFDPNGGYFHPDHIHINKAAVQAFYESGDSVKYGDGIEPYQADKLYYRVFPRKFMKYAIKAMKIFGKDPTKFGKNQDIDLEVLAGSEEYPLHVYINVKSVIEQAISAAECHRSQLDFGRQGNIFMRWYRKTTSLNETFMLVYPEVSDDYRTNDLFAD